MKRTFILATGIAAALTGCGKKSEANKNTTVAAAPATTAAAPAATTVPGEAPVTTAPAIIALDTTIHLAGSLEVGAGLAETAPARVIYATSLESPPAASRIEIKDGKYEGDLPVKSSKPVDIALVIRETKKNGDGTPAMKDGKPVEVTVCAVEIPNPRAGDGKKARSQITVKPGGKLTLSIAVDQQSGGCAATVVAADSTAFDYDDAEVTYEPIPAGRFQGLWGIQAVDADVYDPSSDDIASKFDGAVAEASKYDDGASDDGGSAEGSGSAALRLRLTDTSFMDTFYLNEVVADNVVTQVEMYDGIAHDACYDKNGAFAPRYFATGLEAEAPLDLRTALASTATASAFFKNSLHAAVEADLGVGASGNLDTVVDQIAGERLAAINAADDTFKDLNQTVARASIVDGIYRDLRAVGRYPSDGYCANFGPAYAGLDAKPSEFRALCELLGDKDDAAYAAKVDAFVAHQGTASGLSCELDVRFDVAGVEGDTANPPAIQEQVFCENGPCADARPGLVGIFEVYPGQLGSFSFVSDQSSSEPVDVYTGGEAETCEKDDHKEISGVFDWQDESGKTFNYDAFFAVRTVNTYDSCARYYEGDVGEKVADETGSGDAGSSDAGSSDAGSADAGSGDADASGSAAPEETSGSGSGIDVVFDGSGSGEADASGSAALEDGFSDDYNEDPYATTSSDKTIWVRLSKDVNK